VDESASFRSRARHCRELAKGARDEPTRRTLNDIANGMDEEAAKIDAEKSIEPGPAIIF
jgi:hypothetical protein